MTDSWGTLTFEVPDFLESIRDAINSVAEFLVAMLDIALQALNFVKTFLVGFLDPIVALIRAILDELQALLRDLRKLGVYITGDWFLMSNPENLVGGFAEYERRMIARLTDRSDPTRPDVSGNTTVLSNFLYLSVGLSEYQRLRQFIEQVLKYFKQSYTPVGLPRCKITKVLYGASAASMNHPSNLGVFFSENATPPSMALVKWEVIPSSQKSPFNPFPPTPPGGFLITVSTLRDGIPLAYDRPRSGGGVQTAPNGSQAQPRDYGLVRDTTGIPIVLHGGNDMLGEIPASMQYNAGVSDGIVTPGRTRLYGLIGPTKSICPLDELALGGYYQKTYYVPVVGPTWMTGEFSCLLDMNDLPLPARISVNSDGTVELSDDEPASTFYIRVAVCSDKVTAYNDFRYEAEEGMKAASGFDVVVGMAGTLSPPDLGVFTEPTQVVFPNASTKKYLEALKIALVVLVLSRPDLVPIDTLEGTVPANTLQQMRECKIITPGIALERCGLEGMAQLADLVYVDKGGYKAAVEDWWGITPATFRQDLLARVDRAANDIYSKTGPMPDIEAFVVQQTQFLRTVTWKQLLDSAFPGAWGLASKDPAGTSDSEALNATVLESLNVALTVGACPTAGVTNGPWSMGLPSEVVSEIVQRSETTTGRLPQMQEGALYKAAYTGELSTSVSIADAPTFLAGLPAGVKLIYEKCLQDDGSILVPEEWRSVLEQAAQGSEMMGGSADESPVLFFGGADLSADHTSPGKIIYCRGIFAKANSGQMFQETAITLSASAAAYKTTAGEWISVRWLDSFPGIEKFLATISNWLEAVAKSLQSILDNIIAYINFLEGRVVETQQLISRINSLLQSILGFLFKIPQCSALCLVSNGTGGVLADLVTAQNKPSDSPLSYGGGVALVVPVGPGFIMDLIREIMTPKPGVNPNPDTMLAADPSSMVAISGVAPTPAPNPEPDVL